MTTSCSDHARIVYGDCSWQAQHLVMLEIHFSWQVQYLVMLESHFSWPGQHCMVFLERRHFFVAGATLGDVGVSLFVAGATYTW